MLSTTHASVQVDSAPPSGRRCPEVLCHIMTVDMGCSTVTQLLVKSCSCPLYSTERRCNVAAHTPRNLPLTALPAYGFGQRALFVCQLLQRKPVVLSHCVEHASWLWCAYTVRQGVARLSAGVSQHRSCCSNSSRCSNSSSSAAGPGTGTATVPSAKIPRRSARPRPNRSFYFPYFFRTPDSSSGSKFIRDDYSGPWTA